MPSAAISDIVALEVISSLFHSSTSHEAVVTSSGFSLGWLDSLMGATSVHRSTEKTRGQTPTNSCLLCPRC